MLDYPVQAAGSRGRRQRGCPLGVSRWIGGFGQPCPAHPRSFGPSDVCGLSLNLGAKAGARTSSVTQCRSGEPVSTPQANRRPGSRDERAEESSVRDRTAFRGVVPAGKPMRDRQNLRLLRESGRGNAPHLGPVQLRRRRALRPNPPVRTMWLNGVAIPA